MSEQTEAGITGEVIEPKQEPWGVVDVMNEIMYGKDQAKVMRERRMVPVRFPTGVAFDPQEEVTVDEKTKRDLPKLAGHLIGLTLALCICLLLIGGTIWALRGLLS